MKSAPAPDPDSAAADPRSLSLYVHLPWCVRKCPYCDFNSHQLKAAQPDPGYLDALILDFESELPLVADRRIDTVFFGGGTPSLFSPADFARLMAAVRERMEVAENAEITLEANPGTIERGKFTGYADAGINRVSLGAQTFSAHALERLGRIHTPDDTLRAVEELRLAGIENFNLDLMYALPEQSLDEARHDVVTACALGPTHISYYQLTLEPGTVFHARPPPLPDEEAAWSIETEGRALLAAAGYRQYEVSAFALEGFQCRHNTNYWQFGDYLGIGAGAHGKLSLSVPDRIQRSVKPRQPRDYQAMVAQLLDRSSGISADRVIEGAGADRHFVPPRDLPFEFMLNALRLYDGFSDRHFEARTGLPVSVFEPAMHAARERGLIERTSVGWTPTLLGRSFLNDLQSAFLA